MRVVTAGRAAALAATLAGCSGAIAGRRVVLNPELGHGKVERFANLYPSRVGTTPYDEIDFLRSEEKAARDYREHGDDAGSQGIDRVHGFRPADFQQPLDWATIRDERGGLRVTWLGHATFLVQLGGGDFLIDPVLTDLPVHWLLDDLERASPPVVSARELGLTDAVLVSHNHYDHLDFETLDELPAGVRYLVPLRAGHHFGARYRDLTELDWYTSVAVEGVEVTFVPAQHRSNRTFWDGNESLWGGWVLRHGGRTVYYAGDTGFSEHFEDIHRRFGDIDVCLLPVIAYRPYAFRRSHMTPEWALEAAVTLGCKTSIPWGYGTFTLGAEHVLEPLRRLERARADLAPDLVVRALKMGETARFD